MVNFDRDKFDDMTTEQKIVFVNDLVVKNIKLTEKEIKYLVPQNRSMYFYNRVKTTECIEDYEIDEMNDDDKEIFILNRRFLHKSELKKLSTNLQLIYIRRALVSGIQLSSEEFNLLKNDELKKYYADEKGKINSDITLTAEELKYIDSKGQIQFINMVVRMGLSPSTDEIKSFKPEALRYYQSHRTMTEIRSIIKQELRKILS